ncbi:cysteine desulfurase family protein [Pendulispora albinea]|uniref:Cysteine desulfurase n=1 Tax=Pendulispora albinea TaxID=2741071 RepID=A0ABZ2MCE6_9BACT
MTARVYLDWNATTPPLDEVIDAMHAVLRTAWANPSSIHLEGRGARSHVEGARAAVAELAGVDPRDIVLTSGGTEANNLALRSAFARTAGTLVTSRIEHPSITRVAEALEAEGKARVRWLRVQPSGAIDVDDLERALATEPDVRLLALQAVNHETGVVQPTAEAIALASTRGVWVHVDAVQAFGRIDVGGISPGQVSCQVAGGDGVRVTRSMAAHKMRGPKGIGALVTRADVLLEPVLRGGAQERGIRPGTLDPVAAAGFAVAARHARSGQERYAHVAELRDRLEAGLLRIDPRLAINGDVRLRAPHVTNVAFSAWSGPELVAALDLEGVSISSGSACSAGTIEPSPVITAMHDEARARRSVRFSLGEGTTSESIEAALVAIDRVFARSHMA